MAAKAWKCRKCEYRNRPRSRKCVSCGKLKPKKKIPAHMKVLSEMTYDDFVKLNGGEFCWICREMGIPHREGRPFRYHRDHDHRTGEARGLLCWQHNSLLKSWVNPELLMAAYKYLTRKR